MRTLLKFFDKLEDRTRGFLSHYPMFYAIVGGFFIVIFWRGVWETGDILARGTGLLSLLFYPPVSVIVSALVMMVTGLFVSFFIGDRIILTGIKNEKKLTEKTEEEIKQEETMIINLAFRIEMIEKSMAEINAKLDRLKGGE